MVAVTAGLAANDKVVYPNDIAELKKTNATPQEIFEFLYQNDKNKEEGHISLARICYRVIEADLNIGALFYAISFFRQQAAKNFVDSYTKFKEGHLKRITHDYYMKEDGVTERRLFDLALEYAIKGDDNIFLDNEAKEKVLYFMHHGEVESEKSTIINTTTEALTSTLE